MGSQTKIQWTDATVNFWTGCRKVSAGCKFCYMFRDKERWNKDPTDIIKTKSSTILKTIRDLIKLDNSNKSRGIMEPLKIFTCSWSDFFIEEADQWRKEAWDIIRGHPQFIWQILTKRPERILQCLPDDWGETGYSNVWLGVSIESDNEKHRLNQLHVIKTLGSQFKIFVSYEPAIGYLDLANDDLLTSYNFERLDWLIMGGESGHDNGKYKYRPADLGWFNLMIEDCKKAGVPIFIKQLGTFLSQSLELEDRHGGNIDEWPEEWLKVRQFPK